MAPSRAPTRPAAAAPAAAADPRALRREPEQMRAKRSLDAILGAAAELVGEQGTDGFSMAELARRAGVSKPALYRYFPNKRAILVRLARASFEDNARLLAEAMTPRPGASEAEIYREAISAYCALQRS